MGDQSVGEWLRRHGRSLPNGFRARLASAAGASQVLEGSILHEWVEDPRVWEVPEPGTSPREGELPQELAFVLDVSLILQGCGQGAEKWAELRREVRRARSLLDPWPGHVRDNASEDPTRAAWETVETHLEEMEAAVKEAEDLLIGVGWRWNWDRKEPVTPTGNRPRGLLRHLVETLVVARLRSRLPVDESQKVREELASELSPWFGTDLLDTRKDGPLANAVKAALG